MSSERTKKVSPIQLVLKAGLLVDELSALGPSTPADLAKATDEPRPSVYRILSTLEKSGLVRRSENSLVELGTGILRLGEAASDALIDRNTLTTVLEDMQSRLGLTSAFWIYRNNTAVCLDQVDATDVDLHALSSGRILPLHAGAASHVILAFSTPEILDSLIKSAPFPALAPHTPTGAKDLVKLVEKTRNDGWRLEVNEVVNGIAAIGFPVFNPDGTLFGALTVAGLVDHVRATEQEVRKAMEAAAMELGEARQDFSPAPTGAVFDAPDSQGSVLAKAGTLISALASERVATSSRLTELINEPASSVYRMLGTLQDIGWIEQLANRGAFRIGSKMISLAGNMLNSLDVRRASLPILRSIHDATGETVFLCVRRNSRAVCIERIEGKRVNSRLLSLGSSLPLHVGAAPRALLAFEERPAWEDYAALLSQSPDERFSARSKSKLLAELQDIRDAGYVVSDDELTPGIAAVGAPIYDHRNHVVASLSISGLREGILASPSEDSSAAQLVIQGARELSSRLGARLEC
ncbi:hypothetical protein AOZ07_17265 [Glutamicibacter halophytocola]|uniref:IclR family transcriptional regulator n=1 Tax=Glutamicibacter halophytocola TaxID=1933880 RepID=UPI0006D4AF95|nr:IclR family transcriptional regulator [Glutamicibacter halophytocola]ALG30553.1 hypothetical protein AOZ07_17265 [Glutamicibacter halophytocola]